MKPRTGKSEFISCLQTIRTKLSAGETIRVIHTELSDKKMITLKYAMFCRYVKKLIDEPQLDDKKVDSVVGQQPSQKEIGNKKSNGGFGFNSKPSIDDLA